MGRFGRLAAGKLEIPKISSTLTVFLDVWISWLEAAVSSGVEKSGEALGNYF